MLQARDICVEYDGKRIVDHVSLQLNAREITCIEGASGSGKSTLLRALATLVPTTGELLLDGHTVKDVGTEEFRRRVAYVPQAPRMFPGSVADNLGAGPGFRGISVPHSRVCELLAQVGLSSDLASREGESLSGGERLRVALARALANDPNFLLVDEPTAALDADSADFVLEQLLLLARAGTGVVVVTHIIEHAARLGGQTYRMRRGQLGPAPRQC